MKKLIGFVIALALSNSTYAVESVVDSVRAVCHAPSQQGKYWKVTANGGIDAKGSIRLLVAGIDGEAAFTKEEWDGVQQVLKEHQANDNESYRRCAAKLTPLFLEKAATPPVDRPKNIEKERTSKAAESSPIIQINDDVTNNGGFIINNLHGNFYNESSKSGK